MDTDLACVGLQLSQFGVELHVGERHVDEITLCVASSLAGALLQAPRSILLLRADEA